jgi:hypothetical protein
MNKLAEETGKVYTKEDEEGISFTEEGQDIFNDMYDDVKEFLTSELEVEYPNYLLDIKVLKQGM